MKHSVNINKNQDVSGQHDSELQNEASMHNVLHESSGDVHSSSSSMSLLDDCEDPKHHSGESFSFPISDVRKPEKQRGIKYAFEAERIKDH